MIALDIRSYIAAVVPTKRSATIDWQKEYRSVPQHVLEDATLHTAKLLLDNLDEHHGEFDLESFNEKATDVRIDVRHQLGGKEPGEDGGNPHALSMATVIVAGATKLAQECLDTPDTEIHKAFLDQARHYKSTPSLKQTRG